MEPFPGGTLVSSTGLSGLLSGSTILQAVTPICIRSYGSAWFVVPICSLLVLYTFSANKNVHLKFFGDIIHSLS